MLTESANKWAQIGPATLNNGTRVTYAQCYNGSDPPVNYVFPSFPNDSKHLYGVVYDTGDGSDVKLLYIDGAEQADYCDYTFVPTIAQAVAENHSDADQVPGIPADVQQYTTIQSQDANGTWDNLLSAGSVEYILGVAPPSWWHYTYDTSAGNEYYDDARCS